MGKSSKLCVICGKRFYQAAVKFYKVPQCEVKRKRWIDSCGLVITTNDFVCEKHFSEADFTSSQSRRMLMPGAVPLLHVDTPETMDAMLFQSKSTMIECAVQTEDKTGFSYRLEMYSLREEIEVLKAENAKLLQENNKLKASLSSIFTEGQVKKIMNPGMKINWTWEDISNAICCHAAGPRAYQYYYGKGFPLPHFKTLQAWARKNALDEGILSFSIECLKSQKNLSTDNKICVLSFDEMKKQEAFEYDPSTDTVKHPCKYVQMAIVRGLKASWKQPIYFGFDNKMTKKVINQILSAVHEVSFPVVAVVSDMGPTNQALWTELQVSREKPWFQHPVDKSHRVFVFADVPHLLKLIRDHFLDTGLLIDKQIITSQTIKQVMTNAKVSDASIVHKLTDEHFSVQQSGRQKVELAAQLFSNTTADAIRRCYQVGMEVYLPLETSDFIKLVNDWFEIHNSKKSTFYLPGKRPYGLDLPGQISILERMDAIMERPILPGKTKIAPFQKGILISNMALRMLHEYVSGIYGLSYVVTYRCNQDVLENFFGALRSEGGQYDHPTPMQYKYRLRKYLLVLNDSGNTEVDETNCLSMSSELSLNNITEGITSKTQGIDEAISVLLPNECKIEQSGELEVDKENVEIDELHQEGLENIAGFIIRKLNLDSCEETSHPTWTYVDEVSRTGKLKKPSSQFLLEIQKLEEIFNRVNGDKILSMIHLRAHLLGLSSTINLPEEVRSYFFKCRIYFRIKDLNDRLQEQKQKQKLIGSSKLLKLNLLKKIQNKPTNPN